MIIFRRYESLHEYVNAIEADGKAYEDITMDDVENLSRRVLKNSIDDHERRIRMIEEQIARYGIPIKKTMHKFNQRGKFVDGEGIGENTPEGGKQDVQPEQHRKTEGASKDIQPEALSDDGHNGGDNG